MNSSPLGRMSTRMFWPVPWNRTNGGVTNGGVSPKHAERNKIGRICAKLAGFARNWPNLLVITGGVYHRFCQICADLRKTYGHLCYGTFCSCQKPQGGFRLPKTSLSICSPFAEALFQIVNLWKPDPNRVLVLYQRLYVFE